MPRRKKTADAPAPPPEVAVPDPAERRVSPDIRGVEAVMGDGRTWLLARTGLCRALSETRNRLFERLLVDGEADLADLTRGCWYALRLNYNLGDDELAALIRSTDSRSIVDAVAEAVLPVLYDSDRTFDDWARSALIKAGLKPAEVAADDLPHVLLQIVAAGDAVPLERFTEAGRHVAMRKVLRGMLADQERERAAMRATE